MKKWLKRLAKIVGYLVLTFVISLTIWLENSTVIRTEGGVYQRIRLPIAFSEEAIGWDARLSIVADEPKLARLQGPVVSTSGNGQLMAEWYCIDQSYARAISPVNTLSISCAGETSAYRFRIEKPLLGASSIKTDAPIAVTSDLEGNLPYFKAWAQDVGALNEDGRWAFGTGHVVIIGDMLDRGRYIHELLWFIYDLEQQAEAAGGGLHILIGNHEQYAFDYIFNRNDVEHLWAIEQLMRYDEAFSHKTILGSWLRAKPIALKINNILFVHGGFSEKLMAANLSLDELNALHLQSVTAGVNKEEKDLLYGLSSPTRYRGYVYDRPEYPLATDALIDQTLSRFDAEYIVTGHNPAEKIEGRYSDRVFVTDVKGGPKEALTFKGGKPEIVKLSQQKLEFADPAMQARSFSILNTKDWAAFLGVFALAFR
ncbi:MAG: metallophosphoesterase [Kordiimonadaceae bacterium]|nr:metallophosphoesterase [Kordiimonadaceae bacterium]